MGEGDGAQLFTTRGGLSTVRNFKPIIAGLSLTALLSACATPPMGPSILATAPPDKPFEVFKQDDLYCKNFAQGQVAGQANQANNQAVGTAVVGTALGAGLGAAVGGGRGAAVGAASGAAVGTGIAANNNAAATLSIQQQYDNAYVSCMLSKGNLVAGYEPPPSYAPPPPMLTPPPPQYDHGLVLRVQAELVRIGLLIGPPDGLYGSKTRAAILDYEKLQGLPRDGIPTPGLLENLRHQ